MLKKILFGTGPSFFTDISLLALRLIMGLLMALLHGMGKIPPSEKFISGVAEMGFPLPVLFAWSAGLAEMVGGLLLAIGLFTRPAAFFIAFTMGVAAFGRHLQDPWAQKELSLLYLTIAVFFFFYGAGKFSLDRFFGGGAGKTRR